MSISLPRTRTLRSFMFVGLGGEKIRPNEENSLLSFCGGFFLLRRSYEYSPTSLPVVNSFSWLDVHKKMGSFTGDYGQTVSVCQLIGYKLMMGYFSLGIMKERW